MSNVLAVCVQRAGALRKISHEVVTGARRIADALGGGVDALVLGAGAVTGADQLGRFGADNVITLTGAGFDGYAAEGPVRRWSVAEDRRRGHDEREEPDGHAVVHGLKTTAERCAAPIPPLRVRAAALRVRPRARVPVGPGGLPPQEGRTVMPPSTGITAPVT